MRRHAWTLAAGILWAGSTVAAPAPPPSVREIFREIARASGINNPNRVAQYQAEFERILEAAADRAGDTDSEMRKARQALDVLYGRMLRSYRESADGVDEVLDEGSYNCVSGTLLAGAAARALGLDARVLVAPHHLMLLLRLDGRDRVVDLTRKERPRLMGPVATMTLGSGQLSAGSGQGWGRFAEVDLEGGLAFLWKNRAERALDRDDGLDAARSFEEAWRRHPPLAQGWEGMAASLARAFRIEYEARRFRSAHTVASIDLMIYPGRTTATDRLEAAALKEIEILCDSDAPQDAEELLERSVGLIASESDKHRMEAASCPVIARAAVRLGDWPRAYRAAERFRHAERDDLEAERLQAWVDRRYRTFQGELGAGFCPAASSQTEQGWLDFR